MRDLPLRSFQIRPAWRLDGVSPRPVIDVESLDGGISTEKYEDYSQSPKEQAEP